MNLNIVKWVAFTSYVATIVGANWATTTFGLIGVGLGLVVTAGTFFAGAALVARDWVQVNSSRTFTVGAILLGSLLSWWLATPAIALASGIAFLVSELVDMGVFTPLRSRSLTGAIVISSVVSAPVDTVLFLQISGFGVTWAAVLGQFMVKTLIALLAAGVISAVSLRREESDHA